jgi:hypothetical protein
MSKIIRLTEKDLTKIVNRIISEQPKPKLKPKLNSYKEKAPQLPSDNPLYIEMDNWVTGDGPEVMKYIPNKMLVIGTWDGTKLVPDYTITKH